MIQLISKRIVRIEYAYLKIILVFSQYKLAAFNLCVMSFCCSMFAACKEKLILFEFTVLVCRNNSLHCENKAIQYKSFWMLCLSPRSRENIIRYGLIHTQRHKQTYTIKTNDWKIKGNCPTKYIFRQFCLFASLT